MHPVSTAPQDLYPEVSDRQAVAEVNRGNREMFEVLVRRYNCRLYRIGVSYLGRHDLAEDAMQEAYLKAFVHLPRFQEAAAFSTWLTRIMINECLMVLRRRRAGREAVSLEDVELPDESAPVGAARAGGGELKVLLENAIGALPKNLRTVYVLREVQHLSTEEAAECLGVSPGNIKVRLHRAREQLKAAILSSAAGIELFPYQAEYCDPFTARVMQRVMRAR